MQNYDLNNTGSEVQERLDQVPVTVADLAEEREQRAAADNQEAQARQEALQAEAEARAEAIANEKAERTEAIATEKAGRETGDANLQQQIDELKSGMASLSFTATPSVVHVGTSAVIGLSATSSVAAQVIVIRKGASQIMRDENTSALKTTNDLTTSDEGTSEYFADFTIAGIIRTLQRNVQAVHPVLYGAGGTATAATSKATPRTTCAGTYAVTVPANGDKVFFLLPQSMPDIAKATLNGFDFPLDAPTQTVIGSVAYKVFASQNTYDAGMYNIVLTTK